MNQKHQPTLTLLNNDARLRDLADALDALHTAAGEDALESVTSLSNAELLGWLREVIYTAQETICELDNRRASNEPILRLVEKPIVLERAE